MHTYNTYIRTYIHTSTSFNLRITSIYIYFLVCVFFMTWTSPSWLQVSFFFACRRQKNSPFKFIAIPIMGIFFSSTVQTTTVGHCWTRGGSWITLDLVHGDGFGHLWEGRGLAGVIYIYIYIGRATWVGLAYHFFDDLGVVTSYYLVTIDVTKEVTLYCFKWILENFLCILCRFLSVVATWS